MTRFSYEWRVAPNGRRYQKPIYPFDPQAQDHTTMPTVGICDECGAKAVMLGTKGTCYRCGMPMRDVRAAPAGEGPHA